MTKEELLRIRKRAFYLIEVKNQMKADKLLTQLLAGDAADLLNLLEYVECLQRKLKPKEHHNERLLTEAEIAVLLRGGKEGNA